jgi:hypothetical protein
MLLDLRRPHQRLLGAALLAATMTAVAAPAADAAPRNGYYGYVTAESRYGGFATITAPVRIGPQGRAEVRLPGGTWIECGQSCRDTLRRETIDFWASRDRNNGGTDGPGYLHFHF